MASPDRTRTNLTSLSQFFDASSTAVGSTVIIDRVSANGFTTFADGVTLFDDTTHLHNWAKYVRNGVIPTGSAHGNHRDHS